MNKLSLILTFLPFISFGQYHARYLEMNATNLSSAISQDFDWDQVDTVNLYKNDFMMAIAITDIYYSGQYCYMENYIYKSNIPGAQGQKDRALIDYKTGILYDLNRKESIQLEFYKLPQREKGVSENKIIMENDDDKVQIFLSDSIPSVVRHRLITKEKLPAGITEMICPVQKITLLSNEKQKVNLDSYLNEATQCRPSGKTIDTLFRRK